MLLDAYLLESSDCSTCSAVVRILKSNTVRGISLRMVSLILSFWISRLVASFSRCNYYMRFKAEAFYNRIEFLVFILYR